MTILNVLFLRFLAAATAAAMVSLGAIFLVSSDADDAEDPGEYSAFTRKELRTNWKGTASSPLLVPTRLPAGAATAPEVGFSLENVVTDPERREPRVWVSYYGSDVLGGQGTAFRIFQRPEAMRSRTPCGPSQNQQFLQRVVGNQLLTICSSALSTGSPARQYWEEVEFTGDLERVGWLKG